MGERTLRGARLGGQSFEDERGIEFAARQQSGRSPWQWGGRPLRARCGMAREDPELRLRSALRRKRVELRNSD